MTLYAVSNRCYVFAAVRHYGLQVFVHKVALASAWRHTRVFVPSLRDCRRRRCYGAFLGDLLCVRTLGVACWRGRQNCACAVVRSLPQRFVESTSRRRPRRRSCAIVNVRRSCTLWGGGGGGGACSPSGRYAAKIEVPAACCCTRGCGSSSTSHSVRRRWGSRSICSCWSVFLKMLNSRGGRDLFFYRTASFLR